MICRMAMMNQCAIIPNRSLDRYGSVRYGEDNFLSSFIFLLASCFLLDFILRFLAMA